MTANNPQKPKRKIPIWFLISLALILSTCCLSLCLLSTRDQAKSTSTPRQAAAIETVDTSHQDQSTPTHTPEPTATPIPTITPEPTATPSPTNTPRPTSTPEPTDTPSPTNTPEPTQPPSPTPSPTTDLAQALYILAIADTMETYAESMQQFSALMLAAGEDVTLILNDEWRTGIAKALITFKSTALTLNELTPPKRFIDPHNDLLEGAEYYSTAADILAEGIDELNIEKMQQASELMILGQAAIERASEKMAELSE